MHAIWEENKTNFDDHNRKRYRTERDEFCFKKRTRRYLNKMNNNNRLN